MLKRETALFGILVLGLTSAQAQYKMTVEGVMLFDRTWGPEGRVTPYRVKLTKPVPLPGDGICDDEQATEIELFDAHEAPYRKFIGKHVVVTGMHDCPRGGHVLRDFSIWQR